MLLTLLFVPCIFTAIASAITVGPRIDLGYEVYEGIANASLGLNIFKGIRFAAPPMGSLRWQAPQIPTTNRTSIIPATTFGATCPQSLRSGQVFRVAPSPIEEDCLFLNVYAPLNATNLPILVWIHGGGYGVGDGREDLSKLINANANGFIGVGIQYRLGAFGFLAGDEVFRNGVVNAGLLDQQFALQWVQRHIHRFGGDASRVTIWGLSAGGGSVMLHNIAYGGTLGTSLFTNSISSSPYLPQQYGYADWVPSQSYYAFAARAGCSTQWASGNSSQTLFQCLISKDTTTLQEASATISNSGRYGTWAFLPVTDGIFIQSVPSTALESGALNGLTHLTSNAAEEGFLFVPQTIHTESDLDSWLTLTFPLFSAAEIAKLTHHYPHSNLSLPKLPTSGSSAPTALDTSATASGHQQRANLIYGESTFVCPSHWLAEAYTAHRSGGYKFQTSTPVALHALDDIAVFGNRPLPSQGRDMVAAVQRVWGAFITTGDPSVLIHPVTAGSSEIDANAALADWPAYSPLNPRMLNWNQTGGVRVPVNKTLHPVLAQVDAMWSVEPGLRNDFSVVDAFAWEGERGARCEFWRSVAGRVPM